MTWELPPEPLQLSLDDEEAGGTTVWYERLPLGCPLPAAGDWVWCPDTHDRFEVVRRGWTFVRPGSPNGQRGHWWPLVRVHVRHLTTASAKVGDVMSEP